MKTLSWQSIGGIDYVLSINDGQSGTTALTPSAQPFVTQTDSSDDLFTPVRPQTGNIGILGEVSEMEALLTASPVNRPVSLTASQNGNSLGTVWKGYLQTTSWSQDWDKGPNEISLPVVSHLGIIESFTPQLTGYIRFGQFILTMSSAAGSAFYTHYVFSKLTDPLTTLRYRFSMDNYRKYDSETGTWSTDSFLTILEDICRVFGWQCQEIGTTLVFLTADDPSQGCIRMDEANLATLVGGSTPTYDTISLSTVTDTIYGANHTIDYLPGRKDIKVTGNVNPINKTIWKFSLDDLTQGSADSANGTHGGDIVYFYTRNFLGNDELHVEYLGDSGGDFNNDFNNDFFKSLGNIRFDEFDGGGGGGTIAYNPGLVPGGYWANDGTVTNNSGWCHSQELFQVSAGDRIRLDDWVSLDSDVVIRIFDNGSEVASITWNEYSRVAPITLSVSGEMGLNYHSSSVRGRPGLTIESGNSATEKGASIVSDRIYSEEQGGRIGAPLKMDTGWKDHIIMSGSASLAETPLVTITPRTQYRYSGLTAGKIFLLKMNVQRVQNIQNKWEDYSGFLWIRMKVGSTVITTTSMAWIKDGQLRTYVGALNFVNSETGLAVPCPSVSGQITIEIGVPAVTTDYWSSSDYNWYYSLSNISLEYTYDWRICLWEYENANIERRDIGNGYIDSEEVTLNLTTQRGNQFGHGIILGASSTPNVITYLYRYKTPEAALADRMENHYQRSKSMINAQLKGTGTMMQPWLKHRPGNGAPALMCMAQSIDWRFDQIRATLFEV